MPDYSSLLPALSKLLDRVGNSPIELSVSLCDSKELAEARSRVEELEALVEKLRADYNALEYKYRCEVLISLKLTDFCREQRVEIPAAIFKYDHISSL